MVRAALPAADAGHLAEAPLDAVASLAHDAADFGRDAGQALASETIRLSQKAGASSRRARKSALAASKPRRRRPASGLGCTTQALDSPRQAIRQAALAAVVGAATSGHRAESMASRARETAEHARGGARKALQDVTVDSARAAVEKVIDDARSVLPLTG